MLDSLEDQPAWLAHVMRDIRNASFADIVIAVVNAAPQPPAAPGLRRRVREIAFGRYFRWDYARHRMESRPDAFAATDLGDLLADVPRLHTTPVRPKPFEDRFADETIEAIRAADLDVLIRFGFNIIRGEILECARYGVWSYHHGDNAAYRGGPAFLWEQIERNPVTGTVLQVLTDELDGGRIIYRTFGSTDPYSLHVSRNRGYWKAAAFVLRRLRDIADGRWDQVVERVPQPPAYEKAIYRLPPTRRMLRHVARIGARRAIRSARWHLIDDDVWSIALRPRGPMPPTTVTGFRPLDLPSAGWVADPYLLEREDSSILFYEEWVPKLGRGRIAWARLDESGQPADSGLALAADHHMSYPYLFEWDGEVFMTVEESHRRVVRIYRAERFPTHWVEVARPLEDVRAVDPTIFRWHDRWWLLANLAQPGASANDELFAFHANSPLGPWTPHPLNPLVSDVRNARSAGRPFVADGTLYRPAQDASSSYGGAVVVNRVDTLGPESYEETPMSRLEPPGPYTGLHTYNADSRFEVIDLRRSAFRLR